MFADLAGFSWGFQKLTSSLFRATNGGLFVNHRVFYLCVTRAITTDRDNMIVSFVHIGYLLVVTKECITQ